MSAEVIQMPDRQGWIYIAENPSMPGLCKIGRTSRSVEERLAELHDTGTPTPFRLVASWHFLDAIAAERVIHHALVRHRVAPDREWFSVVGSHAVSVVESTFETSGQPVHMRPVLVRLVRGLVEIVGWITVLGLVLSTFTTN